MATKTQTGLLFILIGSLLALVNLIPSDDWQVMAFACAVAGIGSLLALLGYLFVFLGRREFGHEHHSSVDNALLFFFAAIVINLVGMVLLVSSGPGEHTGLVIASVISLFAGSVMGALVMYFLLIRIQDGFGRKVLIAAVIVSVSSTAVAMGGLGVLEWQEGNAGPTGDYSGTGSFDRLSFVILGISAVSSALYLIAVWNVYTRIRDGILVPVPPVPAYYQYTYPCPDCRKNMTYMHEHGKWWCEDCGRSW